MTDDDREMFEACVMGLRGESFYDRADWLEAYVADRERRGAEVEALRAENKRLRDWMETYGDHLAECHTYHSEPFMGGACDCGYTAALAATDAPALPAHLQPDAPTRRCDRCGRLTWDMAERVCTMPQPDGSVCHGSFKIAPNHVRPEGE
jgi:hypothetical protein